MPLARSQPGKAPSPRGGGAPAAAWWLAACGLALAALAAWQLLRPAPCLELRREPGGERLACFPAAEGQAFTLWFLHSYDRAFFAEHYRLEPEGRILLTHMTFKSNLNGGGFEYSDFHLRPDGVGELRNINEPRARVRFMQGSPDLANHTLILAGRRLPLVRFARPGDLVYLQPALAPRWRSWWGWLAGNEG